jgi:hypothetical protein
MDIEKEFENSEYCRIDIARLCTGIYFSHVSADIVTEFQFQPILFIKKKIREFFILLSVVA